MRIAIVGLGNVAEHHVAALEDFPDAVVVGGMDPDVRKTLTFRGVPVPRATTVPELFALGVVETAIVTTPTATHAAVVDEIARCSPCRILVEKPLATTAEDVRRLLAEDSPNEVTTLFHAAAAPEVEWAHAMFHDFVARHGPVVAIDMFVADGNLARVDELRESCGNAWIDLGINALSVAARFVTADSVALTHVDRNRETYGARFRFANGAGEGEGVIVATWAGLEPSKHSVFRFANGALLLLDHQAGAASMSAENLVEPMFLLDDARPRLQWHYRNLFETILGGDRLFDRDTDLHLHEQLLGA